MRISKISPISKYFIMYRKSTQDQEKTPVQDPNGGLVGNL